MTTEYSMAVTANEQNQINAVLGRFWSELSPKISEIVAHKMIHGHHSAYELEEQLKEEVSRIIKEIEANND